MAFLKRTWLARIGTGLNKFIIGEKDAQNKQTLVNDPDSITQQGDTISAENLNDLEDRIEQGFIDANTALVNGLATKVPTSRTVNNKPLSSDVSLTASDVGAVPTSRTINGKALSSNISLTASDVGAPILSVTFMAELISAGGDYTIPNMAVGELKFISYNITTTSQVGMSAPSQGHYYVFTSFGNLSAVGRQGEGSLVFSNSGMATTYEGIWYRYD